MNTRCSHSYSLLWSEEKDFVCCRVCEQSWELQKNGWKPTNGAGLEAVTRSFRQQYAKNFRRKVDGPKKSG